MSVIPQRKKMDIEPRRRTHAHIDMAPLVDVIFLLMIFFILAFKLVADPAITVELPSAETSEVHDPELAIISLTKDNTVVFKGQEITPDALAAILAAESDTLHAAEPIAIRADKNAHVGLMIEVMDKLRSVGRSNFAFITWPFEHTSQD